VSDLIRPLSEACYRVSQSFPGQGAIRQRLTVLSEIHGGNPSRVVPSSWRNCSDIHPPGHRRFRVVRRAAAADAGPAPGPLSPGDQYLITELIRKYSGFDYAIAFEHLPDMPDGRWRPAGSACASAVPLWKRVFVDLNSMTIRLRAISPQHVTGGGFMATDNNRSRRIAREVPVTIHRSTGGPSSKTVNSSPRARSSTLTRFSVGFVRCSAGRSWLAAAGPLAATSTSATGCGQPTSASRSN
jgi:hypothetical protein